jgi:hypothetical protein
VKPINRSHSVENGRHVEIASALALILQLLIVLICGILGNNAMSKELIVELRIGEKGDALLGRNPSVAKVDRQPAGLEFYELRWPSDTKGHVLIKHGITPVSIENVLSVTGVADNELDDEGMFEIRINSTLTNTEKISHDEARLRTFSLLEKISHSGWKVVIPRSMARIRGKAMTNFLIRAKKQTTLDPEHIPSLSEWMQLESLTGWQFYFDRVFLRVQFTREHTLTDPLLPGTYLISITLKSEMEHFRGYVKPRDRHRWKDVLPLAVAEIAKKRGNMESEFRGNGIAIDESYVDPPLPSQPP